MKVITIGRHHTNDVIIDDQLVSRHHVQIIQDNNGNYVIQDMNSTNGTFVNGNKIHRPTPLQKTDIVRIGNQILPWLNYFMEPVANQGIGSDSATLQQKKSKTFYEKFTSIF